MTDYIVKGTGPLLGSNMLKALTGSTGPPGTSRRQSGDGASDTGAHSTPWLTVKEAAKYVGFCDKTIRRACQVGKLKCSRVGRRIRIRREWLDTWLSGHSE